MIQPKELFFRALKQKHRELAKSLLPIIDLNRFELHMAYAMALEVVDKELEDKLFSLGVEPDYPLHSVPLLHKAIGHHNTHAIKVLLESGASINKLTSYNYCPLHIAVIVSPDDELTTLKLLVEHGVNLETKTPDGDTALTMAITLGKLNIANYLIHAGASISGVPVEQKSNTVTVNKWNSRQPFVEMLVQQRRESKHKHPVIS